MKRLRKGRARGGGKLRGRPPIVPVREKGDAVECPFCVLGVDPDSGLICSACEGEAVLVPPWD